MGLIQIARPWEEQPPAGVRVAHKLRSVYAWALQSHLADVGGHGPSGELVDGITLGASALGVQLQSSGCANSVTGPRAAVASPAIAGLFGSTPTTLLWQSTFVSRGSSLGVVFGCGRPSSAALRFMAQSNTVSGGFDFATNNGSWNTATWASAGLVGNAIYVLTYDGNGTLNLVINGVDYGAKAFSSSYFPAATGETFTLGAANASVASNNWWGATANYSLFVAAAECISVAWARELSRELSAPWQLFEPRRTPIFYSSAASTLPTLSNARVTGITATGATPLVDYAY